MQDLDLGGCHATGYSPFNVTSSAIFTICTEECSIHIHLWTGSTEAGKGHIPEEFQCSWWWCWAQYRSFWQPVVAAEESQESSNTSMHLVIADAACQRVSVGWPCWKRKCNLRHNIASLHCIYVHICWETPSATSQSAGPRHQHHQCIGCPCRRTGVDPCLSGWYTSDA